MYRKRSAYIVVSLRVFFSLAMLLFSSYLFAIGPKAGLYFYRADTRIPDEIMGIATVAGTGFATWASSRGVTANNNVLDYLGGVSVRPAELQDRNAGWVSVSGDIFAVDNFLQTEIVPRGSSEPPPIEERSQWIYQISPSADAYNVNWMLRNAIQRMPDDDTPRRRLISLLTFSSEDEWIVRGGVPSQHIHSARRFQYNLDTREFDQTAEVIFNPNYIEPPSPEPQTENLIVTADIPDTIYGYQDPETSNANATATISPPFAYSSSCAGIGSSSSPSSRAGNRSGCNLSTSALKIISLKETPTIISKLALESGYCLQPVNSSTQSLLWTRSYLWMNYCDDNMPSQQAYYDIAGRIVVPSDDDGIHVCLTAPENVITGKTSWDFVQFWPCDIENKNQKWSIINGKIHSKTKPKLYIKFSNWYGLISANNYEGYDEILSREKMAKGFFEHPSLIGDANKEIGISWGAHYYPTSSGGYSESYEDRTYYNMETRQISMLSYGYQAFPGIAVSRYWQCLASNQADGNSWWSWDWAYWTNCDKNAKNQKWTVDDNSDSSTKNPIEDIRYFDAAGNFLYFNLSNTLNYGYPFTQKGTAGWGSSLNILRSYGICSHLYYWQFCRAPKHSYQENGGIW